VAEDDAAKPTPAKPVAPQKNPADPRKPTENVNQKPAPPKVEPAPPKPIDSRPKATVDTQKTSPTSGAGKAQSSGGILDGDRLIIESTNTGEITSALSFDQALSGGVSPAMYWLRATSVTHQDVMLGYTGTGVLKHSSGVHVVDNLSMGVTLDGKGMYQLNSGELLVKSGTPESPHRVTIASAGDGLFLLGNESRSGQIAETGDGVGSDLVIGRMRMGTGELRGWGAVKLSGALINNGRVVADGYGQDRTLDMSSFTLVRSDFAQRSDTPRGWYAKNGGKLELPAIAVSAGTATYTWGDNNDGAPIDMVNSARVTLSNASAQGAMQIALSATDRSDVPALPSAHTFIGVWDFSLIGAQVEGVDLLVRYDDTLARALGLDENVLKLWTNQDGMWIRHDYDSSFIRDALNHTLSVHLDNADFTHFAVSAPEPGTLAMIAMGLAVMTRRRRGRSIR
jgi:hypothetical protein